ncbi:uncharacterized protein IWZ02DRAFT_237616 [Phyllosticta citriasiana]|uniref:uncharacterized protein n=1 Tax=Phyllosticta citriasiana TaxID=595635 RepID=UPI0030FD760C
MVHQQRLKDAAIAMYATLQASGIKFGIFGGYAVSVLGGNRESKDVDCIVSVSKQEILHILDGKNGFKALPQTREDYVAFLWSENPTELVEIFCAKFPDTPSKTSKRPSTPSQAPNSAPSRPPSSTPSTSSRASCTQPPRGEKFHDAADLRWLESHFRDHIKARKDGLDLRLDVQRAQAAATGVDLKRLSGCGAGGRASRVVGLMMYPVWSSTQRNIGRNSVELTGSMGIKTLR